jgi:hypothetical protein
VQHLIGAQALACIAPELIDDLFDRSPVVGHLWPVRGPSDLRLPSLSPTAHRTLVSRVPTTRAYRGVGGSASRLTRQGLPLAAAWSMA